MKKSIFLTTAHHPFGMEFASAQLVLAAKEGWKVFEIPAHLRAGPRERIPHLKRWRDGMRHLMVILAAAPGFFWTTGVTLLVASLALVLPSFWGPLQIANGVGLFGPHTQAVGTIVGFYGAICVNLALLLYARFGHTNIPRSRIAKNLLQLPEGVLFWGLTALSVAVGTGMAWLLWAWIQSDLGALHHVKWALGLTYFSVVPLTLGVGVFQAHLQKRAGNRSDSESSN